VTDPGCAAIAGANVTLGNPSTGRSESGDQRVRRVHVSAVMAGTYTGVAALPFGKGAAAGGAEGRR